MSVLHTSALITWLRQEAGASAVDTALQHSAHISAVNVAEVVSLLGGRGGAPEAVVRDLLIEGLSIESFTKEDAVAVAQVHALVPDLSFGDCACLALARRLGHPILIADNAWLTLPPLGVTLEWTRPPEA